MTVPHCLDLSSRSELDVFEGMGQLVEQGFDFSWLAGLLLIGLGDNILVLRGIERIQTAEGKMGVVQEWHCKIVAR